MIATYKPTKEGRTLNVREEPNGSAAVVRKMPEGGERCDLVEKGWCRLEGGWADARFLTVTDGEPKPATADRPGASGAHAEAAVPAGSKPDEKPDAPAPIAADASGDRSALEDMTIPELRKLAEGSGIHLAKGLKKAAIIDAILSDGE